MSAADYAPGTVAVVRCDGEEWRAIFTRNGFWSLDSDWSDCLDATQVESVRPLVVINPEDREQVTRLYNGYYEAPDGIEAMQRALRSLLSPPLPEAPTGLGAVVEDAEGAFYVRSEGGPEAASWVDKRGDFHHWAALRVVRVHSEGVQ